jgi:hypothetical protein
MAPWKREPFFFAHIRLSLRTQRVYLRMVYVGVIATIRWQSYRVVIASEAWQSHTKKDYL